MGCHTDTYTQSQGSAELWQFNYAGGPGTHPVHIHLVNFQIVSRTGGARGLLPYESAGLKDEVLLEPGEQVTARAFFGPWNGLYMFHCHNMIHEDHLMMDAMNVTLLKELGYQFNSTWDFAEPTDPRWAAKDYDAGAYEQSAIASTVSKLGNLNAYKPANALATAATKYFGGGQADNGEGSAGAPGPSGAPSGTPNRRRHPRGWDMPAPAPAEPTPS